MVRSLGWYRPEMMVLRITLAGSEPKIWRQVRVDSGLTLDDLHAVIQSVFAWDFEHMYQFLVPAGGKLTQKAMRDALRYEMPRPKGLPAALNFFDDEGGEKSGPADEAMLGRVFTPEVKQIVYEYDFGDGWEHIVKLEKRTPDGDPAHVPECLAGEQAAPPENTGGISGYYFWVDAAADEDHESHEEAWLNLGKAFDPAKFDLDQANRRLKQTFKPAPKKPRKPKKK